MTDKSKLADELRSEAIQVQPPPAVEPVRRMRNYSAMKASKLRRVKQELELGPGHEAYDRCIERGSGDPAADLATVNALVEELRGCADDG